MSIGLLCLCATQQWLFDVPTLLDIIVYSIFLDPDRDGDGSAGLVIGSLCHPILHVVARLFVWKHFILPPGRVGSRKRPDHVSLADGTRASSGHQPWRDAVGVELVTTRQRHDLTFAVDVFFQAHHALDLSAGVAFSLCEFGGGGCLFRG